MGWRQFGIMCRHVPEALQYVEAICGGLSVQFTFSSPHMAVLLAVYGWGRPHS